MKRLLNVALLLLSIAAWQNTQAQTYCEYSIGFAWCGPGWEVDDITIGSFSEQNGGCNNNAPYSKNLSTAITVSKGTPTSFTLGSGGTAVQWAIWVDCNADGDFTDASDYFWGSLTPSTTVSSTMLIPASASASQSRIRIASRNQSIAIIKNDACNFGFQAETQDFTIVMNAPGGCSTPVNLSAAAAVTSAFLSWDSTGTQYNVEYGLKGFNQGNGTTLNPSTDTVTVSGLTANTSYDFYVQTDCSSQSGDSSAWNGPISFTTQCVEVVSFPWAEDFNDSLVWIPNTGYNQNADTISNCWDRLPIFAYNYAWLVRSGPTPSNNTGPSGSYGGNGSYMYIEHNGVAGDEAYFTSPVFNTNSLTKPWINFKYHMYGQTMGNLYFEVSSNGGASWTVLDSIVGEQHLSETSPWLDRGMEVTSYKSATFMFRFRAKNMGGYNYGDMAIDNITLGEAPACTPASAFAVTNITGTSADATWISNETKFLLEIGPIGFTQGTGAIDTATTTSHAFSNLAGDTYWDVYIKTDCQSSGNGQSVWAGPYTFRTLITPVWEEDFDVDGFPPNARWTRAQGSIGNPTVLTGTYSNWGEDGWLNVGYDGSVRCNINTYNSINEWFFTELIDLGTGNNWELYFDAALTVQYASASGSLEADDTLKVVISTDGGMTWNDANTILTIDQSNNLSNSAQTFTASLNNYSGIIAIGFYMESTVANTQGVDFFMDNLGIRVPAACPAATGINAWNVNANDLMLGWTGTSIATGFSVEYGPTGFGLGTGSTISGITADSVYISGLNAVTEYDFYVLSVCGTDSSIAGPTTILTGCPIVHTTPYSENFDILEPGNPPVSGEWINCWKTSNSTGYEFRWQSSTGANTWGNTGPYADHTTGSGIFMYAESSNTGIDATLTGGPFDLSQLQSPAISFWYHMFGADMGELHVDISLDNMNWNKDAYVLAGQQHASGSDAWTKATLALSQYASDTIYVRYRAIKGSGSLGDMAIDDVSIHEAVGCIAPTGLTATNITSASADLAWGSYAPKHTIEWGPEGFTQGTGVGNVINNITGFTYALSNLSPNTGYDYYVKDTCSGNSWSGPHTFYTSCSGPLSGTYTIGGTPGATNFVNLTTAIQSLNNCGISGAVTFNLMGINDTGTFNISPISGASALNNVTFVGNGNDYIYGDPSNDYIFNFDGSSYVTLKNITISGVFNMSSIWFHNAANNISIEDCEIFGQGGSNPSYNSSAILVSKLPFSNAEGQNAFNINISGNTIYDGYNSIKLYGDDQARIHGFSIANNHFSPYNYGLYCHGVDSMSISGNVQEGVGNQYGGYGLYLYYCDVFDISGNNITIPDGSALYIYNANENSQSQYSTIKNNMFVGDGAYNRGMYLSNSSNLNIFHNSISGGIGLYISSYNAANNYDIRNNIFVGKIDEAFYKNVPTSDTNYVIDYNLYYSIGSNFVYDQGGYSDLTAWQTAVPNFNTNSIEGDPGFTSASDLHIIGNLPNDAGDNTVGVTIDIDGDTRPASGSTTVDMGADEFTPKGSDVAVERIVLPFSGCGDSATAVIVLIRNMGMDTLTTAPITVNVTGDITATLSATYSGSLLQLEADTVFIGTINTYGGAQMVDVMAYSTLLNDEDNTNDTATAGPYFFISGKPSYHMPDTTCYSTMDSATFAAQTYPGVEYNWFAGMNDTVPVAISDSFTFSMGTQTDWYLSYAGGTEDSLNSSNFSSLFGGVGGLMFDITAKTNLVIDSFDLHSRVNLGDSAELVVYYIPLATYDDHKTKPTDWIVLDTVRYVGAGANARSKAVLNNPLSIPPNATYAIYLDFNCYWTTGTSGNTTKHSDMMVYEGGVGFYNGSFASLSANRVFDGVIYSHNVVCSNQRVMVSLPLYADTAVANFATTVSQPNKVDVDAAASTGDLITWTFGDGGTANGLTASHTYTTGGAYTITCIVEDTVCNTIDTAIFNVAMTIGINENDLTRSMEVFPNPSTGMFNISFDLANQNSVNLQIVDGLGRVLYAHSFENTTGVQDHAIDLTEQPNGMYFVRLTAGDMTAVKKITKM